MKLGPRKATRHCAVCGKSTELFVHQKCGDRGAAVRAKTRGSKAAPNKLKSAAADYVAGNLPPFTKQ